MHLEVLLHIIILTSIMDVVSPYNRKNRGMLMDLDYLVSQLYLQHCTFVEIGEGICSLFVELPIDVSCRYKRSLTKQLYFGNCLCSEFREWQLCSHQLSQQRPGDCAFEEGVSCPSSSARVHRRLCDVTGISQWNTQCNCSVTLGYMPQESLCGFRTCYVNPLPSAICSPRSVCGTAHCNTNLHGTLYGVRCDRKCKDHQPFCEQMGPVTSEKRIVESQWSPWQPIANGDKLSFQQSVAECLDPSGNPAFDCLGPGLFCCSRERGDCICEVKQEDGRMMVFRYTVTFSQFNDTGHNMVKVRSAGNKSQLNVWNRLLDVAKEDDSVSMFSRPKQKPKGHYSAVGNDYQPALVEYNTTKDDRTSFNTNATMNNLQLMTTEVNLNSQETNFADPVTVGLKATMSNTSNSKNLLNFGSSPKALPDNYLMEKGNNDYHQTQNLNASEVTSGKTEKNIDKENNEKDVQTLVDDSNNNEENIKIWEKSKFNKKQQSSIKEQEAKGLFKGIHGEETKMISNTEGANPNQPSHTTLKMVHITNIVTPAANTDLPTNSTFSNSLSTYTNGDYSLITLPKGLTLDGHDFVTYDETGQVMDESTQCVNLYNYTQYYIPTDLNHNESLENSSNMTLDIKSNDSNTSDEAEQVTDVSTECVNLFNNTLYNMSEDLSNNKGQKLQGSSNTSNSPEAAENPFLSNNQSAVNRNRNELKSNMSEDLNNITQLLQGNKNMINSPKAADISFSSNNQSDGYHTTIGTQKLKGSSMTTNSPKAAGFTFSYNNQSNGNNNETGTLKYNTSKDSSNNVTKIFQEGTLMSNSPKAAEKVFSSNNQSYVEVKNSEKSKLTKTTEKTTVTNLNIDSVNSKIITTEQCINNRTTQTTICKDVTNRTPPTISDSKIRNISSESTEQLKENTYRKDVIDDERENQSLLNQKTTMYEQNDLLKMLKNVDPISNEDFETNDADNIAYDEPEPILKDLNKENVDDSINEPDSGPVNIYGNTNDNNKGKEYDISFTEKVKSSRKKLKSKMLSDV